MGLLGQHLPDGELAAEENRLGVYAHCLVPDVLLHLVQHGRGRGLGAYACVVHHACTCISVPVVLFSLHSSDAGF